MNKIETLTRLAVFGTVTPVGQLSRKQQAGIAVAWAYVGYVVYRNTVLIRDIQREQEWAHVDDNEAARQAVNTEAANDIQDISTPLITKTEFVERPGLFGNIDPDITRFTLVYDTDELDESGVLAQCSRVEFEYLRDVNFVGNTVQQAKQRVVAALVHAERSRQAQF